MHCASIDLHRHVLFLNGNYKFSVADSSVLAYLWPVIGRATVVAKKELLYAFPFGPAAYLWGTLFINRSNKSDAVNRLNQESIAIQQHAAKLLFFPEGTRHENERLLPFKKGGFHIAVQSQSYIQPVVVSKYWFLDGDEKRFDRGEWRLHNMFESIHAFCFFCLQAIA